ALPAAPCLRPSPPHRAAEQEASRRFRASPSLRESRGAAGRRRPPPRLAVSPGNVAIAAATLVASRRPPQTARSRESRANSRHRRRGKPHRRRHTRVQSVAFGAKRPPKHHGTASAARAARLVVLPRASCPKPAWGPPREAPHALRG